MYDLITKNVRKSWMLMSVFILVFLAIGYGIGTGFGNGIVGATALGLLAVLMATFSYYSGDRMILAVSRAREVSAQDEPRLHNLVEGLCIAGGMPKPRVFVIEDQAPNAFATGRDPEHGSIAVTRGLMERMNRIELEGVVAHELGHVKNRDTRVMIIAATLVGVIVLIADWMLRSIFWGGSRRGGSRDGAAVFFLVGLVLAILTPFAAAALQAAVSRRREQLADLTGVALTRYPPGLIDALKKLRQDQTVVRSASRATAALWIESPLQREHGVAGWWNRLFDTHPSLDDRIRVLEEL